MSTKQYGPPADDANPYPMGIILQDKDYDWRKAFRYGYRPILCPGGCRKVVFHIRYGAEYRKIHKNQFMCEGCRQISRDIEDAMYRPETVAIAFSSQHSRMAYDILGQMSAAMRCQAPSIHVKFSQKDPYKVFTDIVDLRYYMEDGE